MRRILLAVAAISAIAFVALGAGIQSASAANYNWSGFYMGLNAGGNWGTSNSQTSMIDPAGVYGTAPSIIGAAGSHQRVHRWRSGRL